MTKEEFLKGVNADIDLYKKLQDIIRDLIRSPVTTPEHDEELAINLSNAYALYTSLVLVLKAVKRVDSIFEVPKPTAEENRERKIVLKFLEKKADDYDNGRKALNATLNAVKGATIVASEVSARWKDAQK